MKLVKKIFLFALILLVILVGYILFNTFTVKSRQLSIAAVDKIEINSKSIDHFVKAIQIRTVSPENIQDFDSLQFDQFNTFLKTTYPLTDSLLAPKTFNNYSHLYHWKGTDTALKPVVLIGHIDVVPVIKENRVYWKEDPFGGLIKQDTIWGRGCIDDKIGVIGIMEAVEHLLKQGFKPKRDLYIALGHDEEISGVLGAKTIAAYLKAQGVEAEYIMDEGGTIASGMVPGIDKDVALIGTAEKGFVSLELSIEIEGGHASMPAKETSIDVLSNAIAKLKKNPPPATLSGPIEGFIDFMGPEMPFINKMAFANKSIFKKMIIGIYESFPEGNALVRTTTSPTIFNSGVKENVIPLSAKAIVNFRIISGSSVEDVVSHVKTVIDDERIKIGKKAFLSDPSKVSDIESEGFKRISKTISEIYPEALVSPFLVVAATDARHYGDISDQIFRFLPIRINKSNVNSLHGLNERIAVNELEDGIRFYVQLIKNSSVD